MATPQAQALTSAYSTALSKLQPLVTIFSGFNHRNKNQHRHARWWACFSSLRRNVGRLIVDLEVAAAAAQKSSKSTKKRKHHGEGQDGGGGGGAVEKRARWMRDFAVPEAYLTFSQLVAETQFAVLGIVLLGVLASVHDSCLQLVGEAEPDSVAEDTKPSSVVQEPTVVGTMQKTAAGVLANAVDFGQVVSREEIAAAAAVRSARSDEAGQELPIKRRKKDMGKATVRKPALDHPGPARNAVEKPGKAVERKEKKKKKKKSKGDEFDDLFSSLV